MFYDVRNHLLCGMEPLSMCAESEDMALCMAYNVYKQGCRFILAAPPSEAFLAALASQPGHKGPPLSALRTFQGIRSAVRRYLPDLDLGLGCEVRCSRDQMEQILRHLDQGHLPTMNGSRYVLASFAETISREEIWFCLDKLDRAGYQPVLCGAESLQTLRWDIQEIRALKGEAVREEGRYRFRCKIQLNTASLHFSDPCRDWAREMIRCAVVDVMGTNARNTSSFQPHIREELESIRNICSEEYLQSISWANAQRWFHPIAGSW